MPWSDGLVATLTQFLSYGGVSWWAAQLIPQAKSAVPGRLSKQIWTRPPYGWRNDVARCHALLGVLATPARRRRHLIQAQSYFCRAHQIKDLPNPELACAGLERGRGHSAGLATVEATLRLTAPRKMLLIQVDALVLRDRIRLDRTDAAVQGAARQEIERAATISMRPRPSPARAATPGPSQRADPPRAGAGGGRRMRS